MSHPPRIERPYQIDDQRSQAVFLRRTGQVASFLAPHLRAGMRLIDCGCGPGSITIDLARIVAPGEVVGIDRRQASLSDARTFARERGVANVAFEVANVYQLPFPDRSFDAAFACALLQHLAAPLAALKEIRRVLKPGGVIGKRRRLQTVQCRRHEPRRNHRDPGGPITGAGHAVIGDGMVSAGFGSG
jgi:ubiquinone/menaquinone biosynthesis C-methylase UbiE